MTVKILGIDPGFANVGLFGLALSGPHVVAELAQVITTKKSPKKRGLRQYDDETRRLVEIEDQFTQVLDTFKPDIVSAERFASLRSAATTRVIALAFGAMHALARARQLPFLIHEPEEIKWHLCQDRKASKIAVGKAIMSKFPGFKGWPSSGKAEHIADAAGAAILARQDALVAVLLRERQP